MEILKRILFVILCIIWAISVVFVGVYSIFNYVFTGNDLLSDYCDRTTQYLDNF